MQETIKYKDAFTTRKCYLYTGSDYSITLALPVGAECKHWKSSKLFQNDELWKHLKIKIKMIMLPIMVLYLFSKKSDLILF